jgi:hypothetical protein
VAVLHRLGQHEEWPGAVELDLAITVPFAEQSGSQERLIGHRKCWEVSIPARLTDLE